jgi:ribosomal protein S18 acetylase RimI-like enzyme
MHSSIELTALGASEVLARQGEIAELWPEPSQDRLAEILPRHAARHGFRFLAAVDDEGRLAGFVYGYHGAPGQWWHDRVAAALGPDGTARWLAPGHFELTELHVRATARRRGLGGGLHDAILEGLHAPTAVLSTQVDNEPALRLYEGRGWQTIVSYLDFGSGRPFLIMGRDLR